MISAEIKYHFGRNKVLFPPKELREVALFSGEVCLKSYGVCLKMREVAFNLDEVAFKFDEVAEKSREFSVCSREKGAKQSEPALSRRRLRYQVS